MADAQVPVMFDQELAAATELARSLTAGQWEEPTLCSEWTVREVMTHLAFHTHRAGLRQFLQPSDRLAARQAADAKADTDEGLVGWLASTPADSARTSKVNLAELVIHQQDVRRPLHLRRSYPQATLRACLEFCTTRNGNLFVTGVVRRPSRGLRLVADDLGWASGSGPEVIGPAEALLMAITGRSAALAELEGDGLPVLADRVDETYAAAAS
jgi:uncharacterized protein (TIGR03083 family)